MESQGEREFERGKECLGEVESGVREWVEEEALHGAAEMPKQIEEGERERGCWDRPRRRRDAASLQDRDGAWRRRR